MNKYGTEKPITSDTILSAILYKPETSDYSSVLDQYDFIASSINYKVDPETVLDDLSVIRVECVVCDSRKGT